MKPLSGIKIIELAGTGPGPFCAMVLSDLGADVIRVNRSSPQTRGGGIPTFSERADLMNRGRKSVALDLKAPAGVETVLKMVEQADGLIEPYRPGVMERLGLGPDVCLERNPKLVYGRMTGWGQHGPWADKAGHDINYLALSGVLDLIGREGEGPVPPLNLVGDFGGGAMFLAVGLLAGVIEAQKSGTGQVIDAAMVDGAALLATVVHSIRAMGGRGWGPRGTNLLDTGAPYYDVYATSDGKYMSVGSIEPQFYARLLDGLGVAKEDVLRTTQNDRESWPTLRQTLRDIFSSKTRDQWEEAFSQIDACVAPVLTLDEAMDNAHIADRGTYTSAFGFTQPGPAPRFSRTPGSIDAPPAVPGEQTREALVAWGLEPEAVDTLIADGVAVQAEVQEDQV
jgi:alpha-methylacyl-CoA racemase